MDFGIFMEYENCQGNTQAESFLDSFALVEAAMPGGWMASG
jgi:hypothetical protein